MRDNYDFSGGDRGKHHKAYRQGRTLDEILEQEKPEVVAAARARAAIMLQDIASAEGKTVKK